MNSERSMEVIRGLTLMDDDLMTRAFQRNVEAAELFLHIVTEKKDLKISDIRIQSRLKSPSHHGRDLVLDIDAFDNNGHRYDIEVQRADSGASVKRARFHSAMIDSTMLKAGESFEAMNDSYVIFFTEHDVFGYGLPRYNLKLFIDEDNVHTQVEDGRHIIYVNGEYNNDKTEIGKLIHDMKCTDPDKMWYNELQEPVRHFKETKGGQESMCRAFEEYGKEQRAAGENKKAREVASKLISLGKISIEDISAATGLTPAQIKKLEKEVL